MDEPQVAGDLHLRLTDEVEPPCHSTNRSVTRRRAGVAREDCPVAMFPSNRAVSGPRRPVQPAAGPLEPACVSSWRLLDPVTSIATQTSMA